MNEPPPSRGSNEAEIGLGLFCGIAAFVWWGLFPVYLKAIDTASALEILSHRIVWSVPFGAVIIALRKQWSEVAAAFRSGRVTLWLALSAIAIAGNWGVYIWTVSHDRVLEASLGYYINPLMYVAIGVFVLKERLRPAQMTAVALATAGVLVLTFGAGRFPWAAITLALLFTIYGYIRKTTPVGAMPGLFIETAILSPVALFYLLRLEHAGAASFGAGGAQLSVLLALAGPATVVPLVCFALAARRLRLSTIGFLQYIAPTGQLMLGLVFGERFTIAHAVCFGLIWTALAIFSVDAARTNRAERKARLASAAMRAVSPSPKSS